MNTNAAYPEVGDQCIVTGGSGFIGTHLLKALLRDTACRRIHVVDLVEPSVESPRIEFHRIDLRESFAVDVDLKGGTLFHLAAICKEPGFPWDDYFASNHVGTVNACRMATETGARNLVFTSTEMVFRAGEYQAYEDDLKAPDTAYGMSKLLAEIEVLRWRCGAEGRRVRIVRPGVVFGKGENGNFTRLYHALKKRYFFYIGRDTTIKSCIYVKDAVRFLTQLVGDEGNREDYNLAYPNPTTIRDICGAMGKTFGFTGRVPTVPYGLALTASYGFELLNSVRLLKSSIHHRRIQKLHQSTWLNCDALSAIDFSPAFSLEDALSDWRTDCDGEPLY